MPDQVRLDGFNIVLSMNRQAMQHLHRGCHDKSLECLSNCLRFIEQFKPNEELLKLKAMTLSNLGCFYKATRQLHLAIKFLREACTLEEILIADNSELASTYSNLCVAYSLTGRHNEALSVALKAVTILETEELLQKDTATSYVVACHNVAAEYEHLKDCESALAFYRRALLKAQRTLGKAHPITQKCMRSVHDVKFVSRKSREKLSTQRSTRRESWTHSRSISMGISDSRKPELYIPAQIKIHH